MARGADRFPGAQGGESARILEALRLLTERTEEDARALTPGLEFVADRNAAAERRTRGGGVVWVERGEVPGAQEGRVLLWRAGADIVVHPFQAMGSKWPSHQRDAFASAAARTVLDIASRSPEAPWPFPEPVSDLRRESPWALLWNRSEWGLGILDRDGTTHSLHRRSGFTLADPFPFTHHGREWLFYESQRRGELGRIAVGVVERGGLTEIVDLDGLGTTHRSWPNVFAHGGDIWMLPESGADSEVALWRCRRFPDAWEKERVLLSGGAWTDPVLFEEDGLWWLFASASGPSPHAHSDSLHLFFSKDPWREGFEPHPWNPVSIGVVGSRPAGKVLREGDRLVRPAQDGSGRYGRALVFRAIERLTPTEFVESTCRRVAPPPGCAGIHTWNQGETGVFVDLLRHVPRWR